MRRLSLTLLLLAGCLAEAEDLPAQPRSLAGTDVDGALRVVGGEFVFDDDARRAFDYFLTADGELTPDELDAWVRDELAARLPSAAFDRAFASWQDYVNYRAEAAAILADPGADLAVTEARVRAALHERLGGYPIAADEQAQVARAFAIKRGITVSDRAVARAGASSPAPGRDAAQFLIGRAAAQIRDPADRHRLRRDHFGADAADRLAALDARRDAWSRRVDAFREASAGLSLDDAAALARELFDAPERRRLDALGRLGR